jgi:glycogen debranching enzyme
MTELSSGTQLTLPNVYGYGQYFAFSALDGGTSFRDDLVGTLTAKPVGIRFELKKPVTLFFDVSIDKCKVITGDLIDIDTKNGPLTVLFSSCRTVIGRSPVAPILLTDCKRTTREDETVCKCGSSKLLLSCSETDNGYTFVLACAKTLQTARAEALTASKCSLDELYAKRLDFYSRMNLQNNAFGKLYLKCLSVLKANVYSAEGKIPCRFTTPDRVPHKKAWLWDSAFHALALKEFDPPLAEEALEAVLFCQKRSGMIPHLMSPHEKSRITQPPVLAYGVWEVYQKTQNKNFLERTTQKLVKYLLWDAKHRDKNKNGLLEWKTENNKVCRCGECGMDNSPRFDDSGAMDAVDFSCFFANDCFYLSKIFAELNDQANASVWKTRAEETAQKINELLWNEEKGMYYDRYHKGEHNLTDTCASFLPLFCGIADERQAKMLAENLSDGKKFASALPVPSLALDDKRFSSDMWRGGVWLNYNYMIILGLKRYGYHELAEDIKAKTLDAVNKWYESSGCIYEFYDPFDKERPDRLVRKGVKQQDPDWRIHMHAICDFGWSAAITSLLIADK